GRSGKGVGAIRLGKNASVVFAEQIKNGGDGDVLLMTEKGYAKLTPLIEFEEQGRNGKGLKAYQMSEASGLHIVGALLIDRIKIVTGIQKSGDMHKISTDSIPTGARNTRGEQVILAVMGDDVTMLYQNIFD
ncbi:MAG: DNA gyrase C-terminal beta-propeller domain-containing protein, partial [Christensenella sp.]